MLVQALNPRIIETKGYHGYHYPVDSKVKCPPCGEPVKLQSVFAYELLSRAAVVFVNSAVKAAGSQRPHANVVTVKPGL